MDYRYRSQVLDRLGVRSWINARNWATAIGGNWLDDRVLAAMAEVARTFVDMGELFRQADRRIAELCQVDDAHVTVGCGSAIEYAVAACMAGDDYRKWLQLPHTDGMRNEVVVHRGHYIGYSPQWTASGGRLVEYGQAGVVKFAERELASALSERSCCVSYTVSYNTVPRGSLPLPEVVRVAHAHGLPVVVDAASDLPPVANLHRHTDLGADLVCFSGGKAIRGPNNTGLLLGKGPGAEIVRRVREHTFPHYGWGRGHKLTKEQIVGLVVALEIFVQEGDGLYAAQMETARYFVRELAGLPALSVDIIPNDATLHEHPMVPHVPRVRLQWDGAAVGLTAAGLDEAMAREDPPIFLRNSHYFDYYTDREWRLIDPFFLREDEAQIVADRLRRIFGGV